MPDHVHSAVLKPMRLHVCECVGGGLPGPYQSLEGVSHQEHWKVLLVLIGCILTVCKSLNEGSLVGRVSYRVVRVSWQVDSIELVQEGPSLLKIEPVVDWHHSDSSLLQELDMSLWHIAGHTGVDELILLESAI